MLVLQAPRTHKIAAGTASSHSDYQDNRIWDIRFWLPQGFLPPRLSTSSKDSGCVQRSRT